MKVFILIFGMSLLAFKMMAQGRDRQTKLVVHMKGCIIKLKFKSRTNHSVLIPDFSLRSNTANQFAIFPDSLIGTNADTMIIKVDNIINNPDRVIVSHEADSSKIIVRHNDIYLKKKEYSVFEAFR